MLTIRKAKSPSKVNINVGIDENGKYLNKIKKIAKKMKNKVCPPTHGFFYDILEKQKKYNLLIKRLASKMKKRTKLPTCLIFKVYESYLLSIKKIAVSLKKSFKKNKDRKKPSSINNINESSAEYLPVDTNGLDSNINIKNNNITIINIDDEEDIMKSNIPNPRETRIENKFEKAQNNDIIETEEIGHAKNFEKSQKDDTFQIYSKGINTNNLGITKKKENDGEIENENEILTGDIFMEKEKEEGNNTLSLNTIFTQSVIYKIE